MSKINILKIILLLFAGINNLKSHVGDYQQIATQQQLAPYGKLYDFYILPNGNFVGLFSTDTNNDSYCLYCFDTKFNVLWARKLRIINMDSGWFGDYNFVEINNQYYFVSLGCSSPFSNNGIETNVIDLSNGSIDTDYLPAVQTYYSPYRLGPINIDNFILIYLYITD